MTEVETDTAAATGLLMECDEDELEVWTPSSDTGGEERQDGAVKDQEEEEEENPPPFRVIPIPAQTTQGCSPPTASPVKSAGGALGFMVNGQLVPFQPGGGSTELKLCSHPGGSASGFTTVQIPVTLTLHSAAGTRHISTTASLTASVTPSPSLPAPPAAPDPVPIITGVVSGEAAQKVLSDHNVNFKSSPSKKPLPSALESPVTSPQTKRRSKPAARNLLRKGELGPVCPPDCLVCLSQYKLVPELRGFLCLCSSDIAQSLRNLKKKNKRYRPSRDRSRTSNPCSKVSKTRPGLSPKTHRQPEDFLSEQVTCPASPSAATASCTLLQQDPPGPAPDASQGKLVILVEDFYYGSAPGEVPVPDTGKSKSYPCIHCPRTLRTNIKLMYHMQQHAATMTDNEEMDNLCPHCFRHFSSPFKLQCHLETVHSQYKSTVTCRICELAFGSEPAFLWHMKTTHKPGEMPYICQVCGFRSSFYSDVWSHFHTTHGNTRHLLCQYCLRVMRNNTCFQQHYARHQRKHVFSCDKCRLHFLYIKERIDHTALHHRTHIKPPQLCGLKPGTKVTVRTYSVVRGSEDEGLKKTDVPCRVVDVAPPPPTQEPPKRKPVESLGALLCGLPVHRVRQRCVECLNSASDFEVHFPSLVHCSLCRFLTCCSTSYANHMINNHAAYKKNPPYQTIFQFNPKLSQTLSCGVCAFSTCRGDVMARHLVERPEHSCIMGGAKTSVTSPGQGGAFIPIHLVPSQQTSTQLFVKPLTCPTTLSSPSAMTIKFLGPRPQPAQPSVSQLSVSQLSVVLSSMCHGVPQASCRHNTSPMTIRSWIEQQERGMSNRKWSWSTDKLAEWVLSQREQYLTVGEDVLLKTARGALGKDCQLADCYSWSVDFLLRHDLGLQSNSNNKLPKSVRQSVQSFIKALNLQVQSHALPLQALGCMDEFPIFINPVRFSKQSLLALQLCSSPEDRPVFDVVLSALADGSFLPPLLFFSGTAAGVPEGFPDNVLLEARQEGFTDEERLHIWMEKVWRPHVALQCNDKSFLMVDVHRHHLTDEFRDSLSSVSTETVFIPPGCCCRLQPLDVCVMPVLRDFLQARWFMLVNGGLDGLGLDQLALMLACWLSEVTSTLNSEKHFMSRSFSSVSNLQHVEDRNEATKMISALTKALTQPVEGGQPEPRPEPEQLELLLVMEERKEEEEEEEEEEPEDQQEEQVGEDRGEDDEEEEEELSVKSPSALRLVFDGDSDQDSFHGFHDD
ncbi:uncharacterized protein pogza isoform X2 [Parambassis ranga]|uniref:Uncharacterized protein pogza isoform X2 n=1 Tax=Parambassis ranga TaxID=210632 RepID=A0A6P7JXA1_9TELE|nr:pogo transposable element with ZNF domain isoform X2 [Parambassis ranga]